MVDILFIPNSVNQMKKFLLVLHQLSIKFSYVMINSDKFQRTFTSGIMEREDIPHINLEELSERGAERILKSEKPALVIVGNDTTVVSYTFVKKAKELSIPVLLIQDGALSFSTRQKPLSLENFGNLFSTYGLRYLFNRAISKFFGKTGPKTEEYGKFSDYLAVWGNFTKRSLIKRGVRPDRILVTGSPSMDSLMSKKVDKKKVLKELGLPQNKKTILYAASDMIGARLWSRKEFHEIIKAICDAVTDIDDVQLVIRLHHFHSGREPKYLDEFVDGKSIFSGNDMELCDLLNACDLLVTEVSTLAMEAAALGIPVIIVNLADKGFVSQIYPGEYIDAGVAVLADQPNRLKETFIYLLNDSKLRTKMLARRETFVKDQLYVLDGKSSQRIADLIKKIVKKGELCSII